MKYFIAGVFFAILSSTSFASCISGVNVSRLENMTKDELSKHGTLIKNVEDCSSDVLNKLKDTLEEQSSAGTDKLRKMYDKIPSIVSAGKFDSSAKVYVNREAIKLARRQAALALVKSEINSRKLNSL